MVADLARGGYRHGPPSHGRAIARIWNMDGTAIQQWRALDLHIDNEKEDEAQARKVLQWEMPRLPA